MLEIASMKVHWSQKILSQVAFSQLHSIHFNEIQFCLPMAQQKQAITLQTRSTSLRLSPSKFPPPLCCTRKNFQGSNPQGYKRGDFFLPALYQH